MSALAVIATSTLTGVIGAAAMYVPARLALRDARTYRDEADRTFTAAESLADEVERTRNLPWHYAAIEAAPEPEPAEHEGEVLHVEHATGELPAPSHIDALIAASSLGTPDAVQLRDSVNDEVARRIVERSKEFGEWLEDANAAAEEHVAEWLDVPAGLAKLKQRVAETGRACCDDHGNEPCDPHAGFVLPCCGDCPDWPLFLALDPPAGADEVGLAQALSDEPEHDDEHKPTCPDLYYCPTVDEVESGCHGGFDVCCYAPELHRPMTEAELDDPAWNKLIPPADDTDRPGLWLVLLAIPVALWDRAREWWRSLWAARRERHMVGSGEQATDGDPFAELLAHVEGDRTSEAEELALLDEQWRTAVAAARAESVPRHASAEVAQDKGYRGSRWAQDVQHTGTFPIVVIPEQRDGGDDL